MGRFRLAWLAMQERSPPTQVERFGQEELQEKVQETGGLGPFSTWNMCDEGQKEDVSTVEGCLCQGIVVMKRICG